MPFPIILLKWLGFFIIYLQKLLLLNRLSSDELQAGTGWEQQLIFFTANTNNYEV